MTDKKLNYYIWRGLFTVAYTLTILPFTVNFFKSIATPTLNGTLLSIIPLTAAHGLFLPVFLASLEFTSIQLASSFWRKSHPQDRFLILALFMACQTFAVSSLYYDVRSKDFLKEKKATEDTQKALMLSKKDRLEGLKEKIAVTSVELRDVRRESSLNSGAIRQLLPHLSNGKNLSLHEGVTIEINRRDILRGRRENEIQELFKRKEVLENDLKSKEMELEKFIQNPTIGMGAVTELEYIIKGFFSYKSGFAGFIALLFPISILGVGFVLSNNTTNYSSTLTSFNLNNHLRNTASLPEDLQFSFVKLMIPAIDAHISTFRASQMILNENDALKLKYLLIRQIISEGKLLQDLISSSKLEENAKSFLIAEVEKIFQKQLFTKEEMTYEKN